MNALERARQSCNRAVSDGFLQSVRIDDAKLCSFFERHIRDNTDAIAQPERLITPLNFSSIDQEIEFYVLYGLMQFGSGWRLVLHEHCGRGASETILYGLMNLVISNRNIDAQMLVSLSLHDVAELFGIPIKVEKPISAGSSAITQIVDSDLRPFVETLLKVLNTAGQKLLQRQCSGFASFVRRSISDAKDEQRPVVASLVDDLIEAFGFTLDDKATLVHPETKEELVVCMYKKAQLIVGTLYNNLFDKEPEVFDFGQEEMAQLTAFVDNVLPAVLVKDGVLQLNEELYERIQTSKVVLPVGPEETEMRVAALVALERLSEMSNGSVTPMHLDYLLWSTLGKRPEYRQFHRHYTRDTDYY